MTGELFTPSIFARTFLHKKKGIKDIPSGHQGTQSETPISGVDLNWQRGSGKQVYLFQHRFYMVVFLNNSVMNGV